MASLCMVLGIEIVEKSASGEVSATMTGDYDMVIVSCQGCGRCTASGVEGATLPPRQCHGQSRGALSPIAYRVSWLGSNYDPATVPMALSPSTVADGL
ncbi:hypothetical protein L6452_05431 [Arctium lappa]|uniref:Uncharacterized protein n=1 Tax=Arctium lappa TaxID=4217 RepID=A0ACB9EHF8_ARCLA|nr:hypothetical protein L6452_05431 [Arctium lappa]